jgi:hypothetical protein
VQDQQKSYVDAHHIDRSYEVGKRVLLWVKPHKSLIKLGKGAKLLYLRFVGPFEVVEKKGPMDYRLAFHYYLRHMHDVFHVSILRHYISDPSHVNNMIYLQVSGEGALMAESIYIMYHHI